MHLYKSMYDLSLPGKTNFYDNSQLVALGHLYKRGFLSSKPSNGERGLTTHQVLSE